MTNFSKKRILSALCILVVSSTCFAQDIIITKDSEKISAKVLRITEDNVRYKDYKDQTGPSHSILKQEVASILYESGEVETFDSGLTATDNIDRAPAAIEEKADVYVIRNSSVGSLVKMGVECNGVEIGSTKAKQYIYTVLDPGYYTFVSKTPENSASLGITLEAGKTYYIKQQVKMGIIAARTGLELMNELDGKKALNDCKLSPNNLYSLSENSDSRDNEDLQTPKTVKGNNQISALNDDNRSTGALEIVALYVPDFIVVKPTEGTQIKNWAVWLISKDGKSFSAFKTKAIGVKVKMDAKNNLEATITDETELRAVFNITDNLFQTAEIKFVLDGKELFYDLDKKEWE